MMTRTTLSAAAIALLTITTLTTTAPAANAIPRIRLVLAKLEARGTSKDSGTISPRILKELEARDTRPDLARFVPAE